MPINNSYSQTPKRIFTNKPFIKGMNYTNADLEPYVCRAVSNLELESSNSATKLRPGISNTAIGEEGEIAYRFYNKYVMFKYPINELLYNDSCPLNNSFTGLGMRVLSNSGSELPFFNTIITNNTDLEYNGTLSISGGEPGINITNNMHILALQMNEGDIPHCINNEDFSFVFLGLILSNTTIIHKGFIKLYHHKIANKIVIEIIKPEQVDNNDVSDYGVNLLSYSPSVYKDYVPFIEHDFYNDYMGVDKSKEVKNTIDILTVTLYDNPVDPAPYVNSSTANMIKGVNSSSPSSSANRVCLRPYYAIPYGHYGAIVKASNKAGVEVYYNFNNNTFGLSANVKKVVKETKNISMPVYSNTRASDNVYTGVLDEDSVVIESFYIPSFSLLAYDSEFTEYDALPDSLASGHNTYHIGFNKQSYNININKYSIDSCSGNVSANAITVSSTNANSTNIDISADSRTEIVLNKCKQTSLSLNMHCTCDQYYKCTNDDSLIYAVNADSVKSYYSFEAEYSSYSNGNYSGAEHTIMHAHFTGEVYVYSRFNNMDYTPEANIFEVSDEFVLFGLTPTGISAFPYMPFTCQFNKITSNPSINITSVDVTSITLSNNEVIYCKKYTVSTVIDYEATAGDFVDGAINASSNNPGLHIVNDATDVDIDADYVFFTKKSLYQGNVVASDTYVVPKESVLLSGIPEEVVHLPELTFSFNILVNNTFSPTYNTLTTGIGALEFNLAIATAPLNTINDNDNSTGYSINQQMTCRQSPYVECITDSIYVTGNTTYNSETDFTALNASEVIDLVENGTANTRAFVNIELRTAKESAHISKNYVHIVQDMNNTRHFSIPLYSSAFNSIIGSSIVVRLFPIINVHIEENTEAQFIEYKETQVVEQPLYTIRTDIDSIVDMSEIINDKFKTTALRMCNHLGHLVVYGDETNSNSLYYSAYNNISYFPSNYVITFDNPIVYAYPHKSNLVVFTTEDVYLLYGGTVPSTTSTDGTEIAFTQKLIQANTRLGKDHINTVRTIGKDIFFINNNNKGYLLKTNKYVNDDSDVYLVKVTSQIDDLLDNPYSFARERFNKWFPNHVNPIVPQSGMTIHPVVLNSIPDGFTELVYSLDGDIYANNNFNVIDGDTFDIDGVRYRLIDIDTPEITGGKNERLGSIAKEVLQKLIKHTDSISYSSGAKLRILDSGDLDKTDSNRHLAYVFIQSSEEYDESVFIDINATMLYNGLANLYDENHDKSGMLIPVSHKAYIYAKSQNLGIFNDYSYSNNVTILDYHYPADFINNHMFWLSNINQLYVYANNSYIYIFQSVQLDYAKAITLVYIYNIDNKIYTMYDIIGYVKPTDVLADNSFLGFSIINMNDYNKLLPSLLSFTKEKYDANSIVILANQDNNYPTNYVFRSTSNQLPINVYFDSGNQSISLMNEKLFREIKLSLGALPESLLTMDYEIDLYVDGKLVIPNQIASCGNHIHQVPINKHYKGREENLDGFRKVTFFTPARGRIPRIVFSITSETDINILEYAIVYMQLNAK